MFLLVAYYTLPQLNRLQAPRRAPFQPISENRKIWAVPKELTARRLRSMAEVGLAESNLVFFFHKYVLYYTE